MVVRLLTLVVGSLDAMTAILVRSAGLALEGFVLNRVAVVVRVVETAPKTEQAHAGVLV